LNNIKQYRQTINENEKIISNYITEKTKLQINPALKESKETLMVYIGKVSNLDKAINDINGSIDTFVRVSYNDSLLNKTQVISNNANPNFSALYHVPLYNLDIANNVKSSTDYIIFEILKDDVKIDNSNVIGKFKIPLKNLSDQNEKDFNKATLTDVDGNIIDPTITIECRVQLIYDYTSRINDQITKIEQSIKKYNENLKKIKDKINLLNEPLINRSNYQNNIFEHEKNFVKFSDD